MRMPGLLPATFPCDRPFKLTSHSPRPTVCTAGNCFYNTVAESYFASHTEPKQCVFSYIEGRYNPRDRHSPISYQSPVNFENLHRTVKLKSRNLSAITRGLHAQRQSHSSDTSATTYCWATPLDRTRSSSEATSPSIGPAAAASIA